MSKPWQTRVVQDGATRSLTLSSHRAAGRYRRLRSLGSSQTTTRMAGKSRDLQYFDSARRRSTDCAEKCWRILKRYVVRDEWTKKDSAGFVDSKENK